MGESVINYTCREKNLVNVTFNCAGVEWDYRNVPCCWRLHQSSDLHNSQFCCNLISEARLALCWHVMLHANGGRCEWAKQIMNKVNSKRVILAAAAMNGRFFGVLYCFDNFLWFREVDWSRDLLRDPIRLCPRSPIEELNVELKQEAPVWVQNWSKEEIFAAKAHPRIAWEARIGWSIETVQRQSGKSAGSHDTYYFTPGSKELRTMKEVRHFEEKMVLHGNESKAYEAMVRERKEFAKRKKRDAGRTRKKKKV